MARTCVYQRCLDAILTGVTCGAQSLSREVTVKVEPPDADYEFSDIASSITDTTAVGPQNPAPQEQATSDNEIGRTRAEGRAGVPDEARVKKEPDVEIKQGFRKRAASCEDAAVGSEQPRKKRRPSLPAIETYKQIPEEQPEKASDTPCLNAAHDEDDSQALPEDQTVQERFKCATCPMKFQTKKAYLTHRFRYGRKVPPEYNCKTCNLWFTTLENLRQHSESFNTKCKSDIADYILFCSFCDKMFESPYHLESHLYHLHANQIKSGAVSFHRLENKLRIIVANALDMKTEAHRAKPSKRNSEAAQNSEARTEPSLKIARKAPRKTRNLTKKKPAARVDQNSGKKADASESGEERIADARDASEPGETQNADAGDVSASGETQNADAGDVSEPGKTQNADARDVSASGETQSADACDAAVEESGQRNRATTTESSLPDAAAGTPVENLTPRRDEAVTVKRESASTPKKMKQLTLVEFLQLSGKKKREESAATKPQEEQSAAPSTPRGPNSCANTWKALFPQEDQENVVPPNKEKPFVRIHADTELLMSLLNSCSSIKTEPVDSSEALTDGFTPYSLRRTIRSSRTSPLVKRQLYRQSDKNKNCGVQRKRGRPRKHRNVIECKKCYIPLVRCDARDGRSVTALEEAGTPDTNDCQTPVKNNTQASPANKKSPVCLPFKEVEIPLVRLNKSFDSINLTPENANAVTPTDKAESRAAPQSCEQFACKVCKKSFTSKENLRDHMKLFHIVYMSSICDAQYSSRYRLLRHYMREHTMFKRDECCICHQSFADTTTLKRHVLHQHCGKTIRPQKDSFSIDVEVKCNAFRKHYKCSSCGKKFWLKSSLREHQESSHPRQEGAAREGDAAQSDDTGFASKEPGSPPGSSATLQAEEPASALDKETERPASDVCPPSLVEGDKSAENNSESTECKDNAEIESETMAASPVEVLDMEKATYPCVTCGKQFRTFRNLCMHQRSYSQPACEQCRICGTAFTSKRLLQNHIAATHTTSEISQGYKFHCQFCNQGFLKKSGQRAHELHFHPQQLRVTPVQVCFNREQGWNLSTICSVCNLMFEKHDHFLEHNRYYHKETVFMCTFCCKSFHGLYMLDHHNKLTHYPEETRNSYPYTCHICSEGFNLESHFHAHKLHVHPVEIYGVPKFDALLQLDN